MQSIRYFLPVYWLIKSKGNFMKFKMLTASVLLITSSACTPRPESIAPV